MKNELNELTANAEPEVGQPPASGCLGAPECSAASADSAGDLSLQRHLQRVDVFKVGLRNSFGIDFRKTRRRTSEQDRLPGSELIHYLGEILPLVRPRTVEFERTMRRAYASLEQQAEESFWAVYSGFLPMVHSIAETAGVEPQQMDPILGRAILLFDASRKTKFVTYLEKTLRESIKNLRGKRYAEELGIPLSAGRLVQQILWRLDQLSMMLGRSLSREESELEVIGFLEDHRTRFGHETMVRVATVVYDHRTNVSLDASYEMLEPSVCSRGNSISHGNDQYIDELDERSHQLSELMAAMKRGRFDVEETAILLQRLDLPHDERCYARAASRVTEASLRKRKQRLLVRLMGAKYAPQAPKFGKLLLQSGTRSRSQVREMISEVSDECSLSATRFVGELLNWMSLSESVYRISITDRQRLETYLLREPLSPLVTPLFQKLVAVLIEQERLGFPCLGSESEF